MKITFSLVFICLFSIASSQELNVSVDKNLAFIDEIIQLQFSINDKVNDFIPPDLSDFHILNGPSQVVSQSYSNINGQTTKEIKTTITYRIQGKEAGIFIIPSASIRFNRRKIHSQSLRITIEKYNKDISLSNESKSKCISGDCENGYGTYVFDNEYPNPHIEYKGNFYNNEFNGEGTLSLTWADAGDANIEITKGIWRYNNLDSLIVQTNIRIWENCGSITKYRGGYNMIINFDEISKVDIDVIHKSGFGKLTTTNYSYPIENWLNNDFGVEWEEELFFPDNPAVDFDTESYIGEWENNQKNGSGTYVYFNGYIYDGEWKDDKRNGKGLMIYNNGTIKEGLWINGENIK